ncbi:hypothetical protein J2S41_004401 [Catenuloplanes atrovinosus]|uniref:Uncharacterized protein n=1 Tax=Catenuloplanes atrovinosus TaxID=137266 RepID=A0AAE3YSH8_9ACTN|nr:hypothetical protein [Catenuloplanes atrovinosus]
MRLAFSNRDMTADTLRAILTYTSPVPLFESGKAAFEHGIRDIDNPSPAAKDAIGKIEKVRDDLNYLDGPKPAMTNSELDLE